MFYIRQSRRKPVCVVIKGVYRGVAYRKVPRICKQGKHCFEKCSRMIGDRFGDCGRLPIEKWCRLRKPRALVVGHCSYLAASCKMVPENVITRFQGCWLDRVIFVIRGLEGGA